MEPLDPIFLERLGKRYTQAVEALERRPRPTSPSTVIVPDVVSKTPGWLRSVLNAVKVALGAAAIDPSPLPVNIDKPPLSPEMQALINQVRELQEALAHVKSQLATLSQAEEKKPVVVNAVVSHSSEDCEHWQQLLYTHAKVIRVLELKDAQMGVSLPAFERIELEERGVRVEELQKSLQENCTEGQ